MCSLYSIQFTLYQTWVFSSRKSDLCLASFGNWWANRPHADGPPIKPAVSPVPGYWGGYCGGLINWGRCAPAIVSKQGAHLSSPRSL